jgi:hypothetical protein
MSDATMNCLDLPCGNQAMSEGESKLASFDLGMVAAVSIGLIVTARLVNVMAGWM